MDCDICGRTFANYRALNGHKRSHSISGQCSKPRARKTPSTFKCLGCETETKWNYNSHNKYCSLECSTKHRQQLYDEVILRGEAGVDALKNYLIRTRGYQCEECGISEWRGKEISLHMDHIDGDSDNNTVDNTRLLCPNCHSQTPTYCGRNVDKRVTKKQSRRNIYLREYHGS